MSEWNLRNLQPQAAGPILADLNASGSSLKLGIAKLEGNISSSSNEHGQGGLRQSSILVKVGNSEPRSPRRLMEGALSWLEPGSGDQ